MGQPNVEPIEHIPVTVAVTSEGHIFAFDITIPIVLQSPPVTASHFSAFWLNLSCCVLHHACFKVLEIPLPES